MNHKYRINIVRQFKSEAQQVLMPQRVLYEVCDIAIFR